MVKIGDHYPMQCGSKGSSGRKRCITSRLRPQGLRTVTISPSDWV